MEEFTFGLLGGLLGGPVLEAAYVSTLCREAPNPELCTGFGIVTMRFIVYTATLPLGATIGIVSAGLLRVVNGSWGLTLALAFAGSWSGWATAFSIIAVMDFLILSLGWDFLNDWVAPVYTITRLALPILYAAFLGTVGFNTGATMRQPAPSAFSDLSWSVPLVSGRF